MFLECGLEARAPRVFENEVIMLYRYFCAIIIVSLSNLWMGTAEGGFFGDETVAPIYGEALTEEELEGKIVLVVFWGIDSPECKEGMAHMMQIQAFAAGMNDLVILGSHVQETTPEVAALLEEIHCNFTVYDHFVPSDCSLPEGDGLRLPLIYMFDENGKLAASGTPKEITSQIPSQLREKMEAGARRGFRYAPLEEMAVPEEFEGLKTYFAPNRSWVKGFEYLESIADDDENELASDAQVLHDQILMLIYEELERLETFSETRPGEAAYRLHLLRQSLRGSEPYDDADELLQELRKRRGVPEMISIYSQMESLRSAVQQRVRPFRTWNQAQQLLGWLTSMSRNKTYDAAIRSEASFLLELVNEKLQ